MAKLGKNELLMRIAVAKARITDMTVLQQHLDSSATDAEKLATIRSFCEGTLSANIMNRDSFKNYYTYNYNGSI